MPQPDSVAPPGWRSVTPRLVVQDARGLVEFGCHVFGVVGTYQSAAPAIVQLGDSKFMISEMGERGPHGAFLYVYVPDVADAYRRAIECGATSIEPPLDTPYGDHRCMVEDKWVNTWQIASRKHGS